MGAQVENRGAAVEAGQVSAAETAPAPQGAVPAAPAGGEWMEPRRRAWGETPWSEVKVRERRYAHWVRP